jgi:hypothetical protein
MNSNEDMEISTVEIINLLYIRRKFFLSFISIGLILSFLFSSFYISSISTLELIYKITPVSSEDFTLFESLLRSRDYNAEFLSISKINPNLFSTDKKLISSDFFEIKRNFDEKSKKVGSFVITFNILESSFNEKLITDAFESTFLKNSYYSFAQLFEIISTTNSLFETRKHLFEVKSEAFAQREVIKRYTNSISEIRLKQPDQRVKSIILPQNVNISITDENKRVLKGELSFLSHLSIAEQIYILNNKANELKQKTSFLEGYIFSHDEALKYISKLKTRVPMTPEVIQEILNETKKFKSNTQHLLLDLISSRLPSPSIAVDRVTPSLNVITDNSKKIKAMAIGTVVTFFFAIIVIIFMEFYRKNSREIKKL